MTTTTTTTIDLAHPVQVVTDHQVDGLGYRAECGCGWAGPWQVDQTDAEVDALDHPEVAVGPGDGLDAVMSNLLDLQDDLAAMVVWLAEHWSADLPVPTVYARLGGTAADPADGVELSVCTLDRGVLAEIAHLLGVPTRDDDQANERGYRYRWAERAFGRVSLRAFTALASPRHAGTAP